MSYCAIRGWHGAIWSFDADRRLAAITVKGDPLEMIARVVPFERFRSEIEATVLTPVREKKSAAGRILRCPRRFARKQHQKDDAAVEV